MISLVREVALLALAQTPDGAGGCAGGEGLAGLTPILIMFAIVYFVVVVPSRKERKQHQAMLEALKRGDEVVTSSGIVGTITDMADKFLTLEISRNVKIRILRSAIANKFVEEKKADEKKTEQQA
jgi:preprotein translocase subunit YajC